LRGLIRRLIRLNPTAVVGLFIVLWLVVAVLLAASRVSRPWLIAYGLTTLVYAFFVAVWAMLRTSARLQGVLDEGDGPDSGLLLEALPQAALVLSRRGRARALNNAWLDLFEIPRNQVWHKKYATFCDPVLRRQIDRARHAREAITGLTLSTRTPDGGNVLFRADIRPLGQGWLVLAAPRPGGERGVLPLFYEETLFTLLGKIAAAGLATLTTRLNELRETIVETESRVHLNRALAAAEYLQGLLHPRGEKAVDLPPARLLEAARLLLEPEAAWLNRKLVFHQPVKLPKVSGYFSFLTYALVVPLRQALEWARADSRISVRAVEFRDDIEFLIDYTHAEDVTLDSARMFDPSLGPETLSLSIARQIVREHDGELRHQITEDTACHFILHLPAAGR